MILGEDLLLYPACTLAPPVRLHVLNCEKYSGRIGNDESICCYTMSRDRSYVDG